MRANTVKGKGKFRKGKYGEKYVGIKENNEENDEEKGNV